MPIGFSNYFDKCLKNFGEDVLITNPDSSHYGKVATIVGCNSLESSGLHFRFEYISLKLSDGTKTIERPKNLTFD